MIDQETQAVIDRLTDALSRSGLATRQFADAVGTSSAQFSAYALGHTNPPPGFLLRAERLATALCGARSSNLPSSLDALESLDRAVAAGDEDWAMAVALELRDRLRDTLRSRPDLAAAWEARPPTTQNRWRALAAAFVSHEFTKAGLSPPEWTLLPPLEPEWVLETPRLSDAEIRAQTPAWLADRGLFIAAKDLVAI